MLLRGYLSANRLAPTNQLIRTFNNSAKKGGVLLFGSATTQNTKKRDNKPLNKKPMASFMEFRDQSVSNAADADSSANNEQG